MTAVAHSPTLLSSCASAATAAEARFRIQRPITVTQSSRVIALDDGAAAIVGRVAELEWRGAHFLTYEVPRADASDGQRDGQPADASLRTVDGAEALLSDELDDADVAVMVATGDHGAQAASVIGLACAMRSIMTAGLVVARREDVVNQAVSALRPHATVLVVTSDEHDVPEMLTALRA